MTHDQTADSSATHKDAGSAIGSVASDMRATASHKIDQAMTEVRAQADGAKDDVANEVKDVATALRHAADELRSGSAQERTLGQIARSLADVSEAIHDKDLGEMVSMANQVGRRNPFLFLGGAALLGFAVSRYAKASSHSVTGSDGKTADRTTQVDTFVNEGNPNTRPMGLPS